MRINSDNVTVHELPIVCHSEGFRLWFFMKYYGNNSKTAFGWNRGTFEENAGSEAKKFNAKIWYPIKRTDENNPSA